ncbi:MAG: MTH1187 family thiamine-binding protein [Gammaproteobacteria bacterium]
MNATAEIQVVPIGAGVSVRKEIRRAVEILRGFDLTLETHASGTNLEGELSTILRALETLHEALHAEGVVRMVTYLKLETRTDKTPTLAGKRL